MSAGLQPGCNPGQIDTSKKGCNAGKPCRCPLLASPQLELQCARPKGLVTFGTSFGKAQETELMHVQFAYAAIGKPSSGEASDGEAAVAFAARAIGTAFAGTRQDWRFRPACAGIARKRPTNGGAVTAPVMAPVHRSNEEAVVRRHRYPTVPFLHPPHRAGRRITATCGACEAANPYRFFYQYPQCRCDFRQPSALRRTPGANPVALAKEL
jgi:hypothetical protein